MIRRPKTDRCRFRALKVRYSGMSTATGGKRIEVMKLKYRLSLVPGFLNRPNCSANAAGTPSRTQISVLPMTWKMELLRYMVMSGSRSTFSKVTSVGLKKSAGFTAWISVLKPVRNMYRMGKK